MADRTSPKAETRAHYERLAAEAATYRPREFHDFRDQGNPLKKVDPNPLHWSRWAERVDIDEGYW